MKKYHLFLVLACIITPIIKAQNSADVSILWKEVTQHIAENKNHEAIPILERIVDDTTVSDDVSIKSYLLLVSLYGENKDLEKMDLSISILNTYANKYPGLIKRLESLRVYYNALSKVSVPLDKNICGIWISGYTIDSKQIPYLVMEITKDESDSLIATIVPYCSFAKEHAIYQKDYYNMSKKNIDQVQMAYTGYIPKNNLASTKDLTIDKNTNLATFYFGDQHLKTGNEFLSQFGVRYIESIVNSMLNSPTLSSGSFFQNMLGQSMINIGGAAMSLWIADMSASQNKVTTLDMLMQEDFPGCSEMTLITRTFIAKSNDAISIKEDTSKYMMYKIYPEYDITFYAGNDDLFGHVIFNKKEYMKNKSYKKISTNRGKYNDLAYKTIYNKIHDFFQKSPYRNDSTIAHKLEEDTTYAHKGLKWGRIDNLFIEYNGYLDQYSTPCGYGYWRDKILKTEYWGGLIKGNLGYHYHGKGILVKKNSRYEGEFHKGKMQGKGVLLEKDSIRYEGEFLKNKQNGYGVCHYPNGDIYEGYWRDNRKEGEGAMKYANGETYSGMWKKDKPVKK
jgi:hypothetical protein